MIMAKGNRTNSLWVLIAIFVGFIVVALFMPLMRIMGALNQP